MSVVRCHAERLTVPTRQEGVEGGLGDIGEFGRKQM